MGIGLNERSPSREVELEHTSSIFGRSPPLRGKLAHLDISLRYTSDESALAVDDAGKPVSRDITRTEEGAEFLVSNANRQHAKWLTVPEDWDFDIDDPVLRDPTSQDIGDDNIARCECALLGLDPKRIAAWQGLARLDQGVQELLAIHIGDQHPCTSPCGEITSCLGFEDLEVVIKQRR